MFKFLQDKKERDATLAKMQVSSKGYESILPYHAYDEVRELFINDSSAGFGWELPIFAGANDEIIVKLTDMLNFALPETGDWYGQVIRWGNNKVGQQLDEIKQKKGALGGIYETLANNADRYYRYAALERFFNRQDWPVCLRDNRLFFFVSLKVKRNLLDAMEELISVRDTFEKEMASKNIDYVRLQVEGFLSILRDWFNHDRDDLYYAKGNDYDDLNPLRSQIKAPNFELGVHDKFLEIAFDKGDRTIENRYVGFVFNKLPQKFALWQGADSFARLTKPAESITCPYVYSISFKVLPREKALSLSENGLNDTKNIATTTLGKFMPTAREAAQEWDHLRRELLEGNVKLAEGYLSLMIFTEDERQKQDIAQTLNAFRANGFELTQKKYLQQQIFLSSLPFMIAEGLWEDLKVFGLVRFMKTFSVINLMPLVADYKVAADGLVIPSFRHQLACFNLFSQDLRVDNRNAAVSAASGSGKSFFVQDIALDVLSQGGRVWIIDKGESYKKLCHLLNGTYIDSRNLRLNPFTFLNDLENDIPVATDLIAVMASPNAELSPVQFAHLQDAVLKAYQARGNNAKIDDVIIALGDIYKAHEDLRIKDIMTLLSHYKSDGQYGRYFNERSMLDPNAKLTVLELGGFEQNDNLLRPVLFSLILTIQEQMFQTSRLVPKLCIIDEAWALLTGENSQAVRFIETGFRTARKHGGSFLTITQGLGDYFKSAEAKTLWENSSIKIILRQGDKSALGLKNNDKEILSPVEQNVLSTFQAAASTGYSSLMLKCGDVTSFHRFFADPSKRILLSTESKQFEQVEALLTAGKSLEVAVMEIAERYYGEEMKQINARLKEVGYA